MNEKEYPQEEPTAEERETIRREYNALKSGTHHQARITSLETALAESRAKLAQEHETALVWHQDNMALAARNVELVAKLDQEREAAGRLRAALEVAQHGLLITHNLDASDDAESLFRNPFIINNSKELKAIEAALSYPAAPKEEKSCEGIKKGLRCSACVEAGEPCSTPPAPASTTDNCRCGNKVYPGCGDRCQECVI